MITCDLSVQMATTEMSMTDAEGEQKEVLSPPEEDAPPVSDASSDPLNFSKLTPCQFGISVQSFTPAAASNRKGESTDWCITQYWADLQPPQKQTTGNAVEMVDGFVEICDIRI